MKIWKPKLDTMIGFKFETKKQPLRDTKNWNFKPREIRRAPLPLYG